MDMNTKLAVTAALQETKEWITFVEHVEAIVIAHLTDKCGDVWYIELGQVLTEVATACSTELMDAIKNSSSIPAEFKGLTTAEIISFVIDILVGQGKLVMGIFLPKPKE